MTRNPLQTKLCDMLGIEFPIVAFTHCKDVVSAVVNAGGFAVLGEAMHTPDEIAADIKWIRERVGEKSFGIDLVLPASVPPEGTLDELIEKIPETHRKFAQDIKERHKIPDPKGLKAVTKADLGVAERALRDASVMARFAGQIAQRYVHRGEFVQEGQRLFELVALDPLEVEFRLPEADAARVREGVPIEVTVAPYPDEVFDATVTMISPTIDRRTRTLRVRALVRNADHRLRPGLFARANIGIAQRENVMMVPEEAVLQRADGQIVFKIVEGNRVSRVPIKTGIVRDGAVEVREGLVSDDRVVSRGHSDLIEGSVIVARNPDGSLATRSTAQARVERGVAAQ